ncbi:MAG: DUF4160 domain-containing protein [Deltaproteobacteria bacterium]|nr:DUF4160 domain-containing protein [Deltaproteobacteria bacterium]
MPEISRFYGIVIKMFFDDHNPPHFHALYGEYEVLIDINTFAVFAGNLPPRDELLNDWEKARVQEPLNTIEPLK